MSVASMFSPVCTVAGIQRTSPGLLCRTVGTLPGTMLRNRISLIEITIVSVGVCYLSYLPLSRISS
jgi:hypothetical protein